MYLLDINWSQVNTVALLITITLLVINYISKKADLKLFNIFSKDSYKEIEAKLHSIDQALNGLITMDINGLIISTNQAIEKMLGYNAKELNGNPITVIIPEKDREAHTSGLKKFRESGNTVFTDTTVEMCALKKDGSEIHVELSIRKVNTSKDVIFVGIIRDITREKKVLDDFKAETTTLKEKVLLLDQAEEFANTGAWRWDLVKKEVTVSKGFQAIFAVKGFKFPVEELMMKVMPDDQYIVDGALDKAFAGESYDITYRIVRPDYSIASINCLAKPIKNDDETITDIYGRIKLLNIQTFDLTFKK